jgi:L-asparaginase
MEPSHILALASLIRERSSDCQGVVLIHGTDTMAFTASMLGFLLSDLGKPVVLTGAQRPLAYVRSDARGNLVDAVELATRGVPEIGICFGEHWLRGVGTEKASVHRFEAFVSPNLQPLADLGLTVRIHPQAGAFERRFPNGLGQSFEHRLVVHTPFPGMDWPLPPPGTRAVLIQAYGAGNLPVDRSDLQALLAHCRAHELPIVLTSQCLSGGVDLRAWV